MMQPQEQRSHALQGKALGGDIRLHVTGGHFC
jgi:hypothetical protein